MISKSFLLSYQGEALEEAENHEVGVIDNSLHLKALECNITTMEKSNSDACEIHETTVKETNDKIKNLEASVAKINVTIDGLAKKGGEGISRDLSDDNPEENEVSITYTNMVKPGALAPQEQNSNPHPVTGTREQTLDGDRMKKTLESARRPVGLKPVLSGHITSQENYGDLNGSEFSEARRDAANDFILKELNMKHDIKILSSKLSRRSP